ncbi:hypothetical protein SAMN05518801_105202 [Novosphingobium sp. CF614]|nr:hypothetical protein [Novosphingobium sp. CF614]SFG01697.1 hypothetical protein SAMN05518801_105202 [Novosphingobium sp. CF614]
MTKTQEHGNRELRQPQAAKPEARPAFAVQETSAVEMIAQSKGKH